jgi:hypothetical protein
MKKVWHCIPLNHFRMVLATGCLMFRRLSGYVNSNEEPFEGSSQWWIPKAMEEAAVQQGADRDEYRRERAYWGRLQLQVVLVHCWCKTEHEVAFLWEEFGRPGPAVAIVSRLERLIRAVPGEVTVGHVQYSDYENDRTYYSANVFSRGFMKARHLAYQREVRAAVWDNALLKSGWGREAADERMPINVDLATLIEEIVVNDTSIVAEVRQALRAADLAAPVRCSARLHNPRY